MQQQIVDILHPRGYSKHIHGRFRNDIKNVLGHLKKHLTAEVFAECQLQQLRPPHKRKRHTLETPVQRTVSLKERFHTISNHLKQHETILDTLKTVLQKKQHSDWEIDEILREYPSTIRPYYKKIEKTCDRLEQFIQKRDQQKDADCKQLLAQLKIVEGIATQLGGRPVFVTTIWTMTKKGLKRGFQVVGQLSGHAIRSIRTGAGHIGTGAGHTTKKLRQLSGHATRSISTGAGYAAKKLSHLSDYVVGGTSELKSHIEDENRKRPRVHYEIHKKAVERLKQKNPESNREMIARLQQKIRSYQRERMSAQVKR